MFIALAVAFALCEAYFTMLEVAMSAVPRSRMRAIIEAERAERIGNADRTSKNGGTPHSESNELARRTLSPLEVRATRALRLIEQPERLTLLFITVTSLSLWATGSLLTWQVLSAGWPLWVLIPAFAAVLFLAEVLPLLIAARNPENVALMASGGVRVAMNVLAPLLWLFGRLSRAVSHLFGAGEDATTEVTEGELRTALAAAEEEGVIESEERAMLEGAIAFREKCIYEVMTPRIDIVGVPASASLAQVLEISMREGHSRLPVYDGSLDHITGIVATKDLLPYLRRRGR